MVNLSEEEGVIDNKEKELVHRSLDFNDILVGEIFTPRIDMVAVEVNQPVEEIRDIFCMNDIHVCRYMKEILITSSAFYRKATFLVNSYKGKK